jgi:uncharacterized protein (TIGR03643 family)
MPLFAPAALRLCDSPSLQTPNTASTMSEPSLALDSATVSRIIEMAWDDGTPFEAIEVQFALAEAQVIALMRRELKRSSFRMWRQRVRGRVAKHAALVGSRDQARQREAAQRGSLSTTRLTQDAHARQRSS